MASGLTPTYLLPYPLSTDPVDVHGDIEGLADRLEDILVGFPLTTQSNTFVQPNIFNVNSTSTAVRITQTGTGNVLLVGDAANPDTSPFVIDNAGNVGVGKLSPTVKLDVLGSGYLTSSAAASVAFTIQGATSQSANLTEWKNSAGTTIASVNSSGQFVGDGSQLTGITSLPSQSGNNGKYLTTDGSTASWATIDLSSKQDVVATVTSTEIGYLGGATPVTSNIQTQLNGKAATSHTHVVSEIINLPENLSAKANVLNPEFSVEALEEIFYYPATSVMFPSSPYTLNIYSLTTPSRPAISDVFYIDSPIVAGIPLVVTGLSNFSPEWYITFTAQDTGNAAHNTAIETYLASAPSTIRLLGEDTLLITSAEIGYLDGVASNIQTQINGKLSATITSPTTGQTLQYNGTAWVNATPAAGGETISSFLLMGA